MSKDEVLKLALEALVSSTGELHRHLASHNDYQLVKNHRVIQSIKAALEAKDEPVAWVYPEFWQHLENLNCGTAYRLTGIGRQPLYTTPPQRTWVGLTDEEVNAIVWNLPYEPSQEHIRAIEAKLRSKNENR